MGASGFSAVEAIQKHGPAPDFRVLFESAPSLFLVLTRDLRVVAASDSYLRSTNRQRDAILGKAILDVFPHGADELHASLANVLASRAPHVMILQNASGYSGAQPVVGADDHHWIAVNSPVLAPDSTISYIIHQVEDVTEYVNLRRRGVEEKQMSDALRTRSGEMELAISGGARKLSEANTRLTAANTHLTEMTTQLTEANTQHAEVEQASRVLTDQLEEQVLEGSQELSAAARALTTEVAGRQSLEEQFRQAQKMEAVGQLAGGVAHDFNNLLTVILSFARFVREDLGAQHPCRSDIIEIERSAERAAALTKQLLAFSRKQILDPKILSLNEVVEGAEKMLRRLVREDIALVTHFAGDLGRVKADRGHLEQILMNLVVNARDAMPKGGTLTIETANVHLEPQVTDGGIGAAGGAYVMVSVGDTGIGMDAATRSSIFLPFFTTKGVGKGTGLGLAMVHGVVKQSRGEIVVDSEPGKGARFKIYLPRYLGPEEMKAPAPAHRTLSKGTATVLVVEDEAAVRLVAERALKNAGYNVVVAASPEEALSLCTSPPVSFDLVLSDVVMPGLDGPALAKRLKQECPALKVLFMSGYTNGALVNHGVLDTGIAFLQKPFTPDVLIAKVHDALQAA